VAEIGGDLETALSSTPAGIELGRNPSLFKLSAFKRLYYAMFDEWFNDIQSALKDTDLIVLSIGSIIAGLSCIDKFPNVKAIAVNTFPCLRTAEFSPTGIDETSESSFG
jgi:hypothetical protein